MTVSEPVNASAMARTRAKTRVTKLRHRPLGNEPPPGDLLFRRASRITFVEIELLPTGAGRSIPPAVVAVARLGSTTAAT